MSYASEVLADSPAVWYRLGDASGNPQDSSGNGHHVGGVTGTPTYSLSGATSDGDTAISLPGTSNNGFQTADRAAFDLGDTFTLEGWIKRLRTGNTEILFLKGTNAYQMDIDTGGAIRLVKSGVAVICTSTTVISDTTTWHHIVCTKSGATSKQYLDGVDVTGTVTNQTCTDTSTDLFMGRAVSGFPANAVFDELAMYSTALSAARVSAHYAAASAVASTFVPRVAAVY